MIDFIESSLTDLRDFPDDARSEGGYQLRRVQKGKEPKNWRPMTTVGAGVREIKITAESGEYRVFYLTSSKAGLVVFHAFEKKGRKTPKPDIILAQRRYKAWKKEQ